MTKRILSLALCLFTASLLLAAGASAKTIELHSFASSFNGSDAVGAPPLSSNLEKVAVNKATGDVIVGAGNAIYKFDSSGTSAPFSAVAPTTALTPGIGTSQAAGFAVDNSGSATQGRIYAFEERQPMRAYQPSGEAVGGEFPLTGSGDLCGVAVDANGNIWRHAYNQAIIEYNPDGTPTGKEVTISGSSRFCAFAMDAQGNFYTPASYFGGAVSEYAPDGSLIQLIDPARASDVAIDRSTGDIYVDTKATIDHFDANGEFVESFGTLNDSRGVGVDESTHTVYALNNGATPSVEKFTPSAPISVADVTTQAPTEVTRVGATVHGSVKPAGVETTGCRFEYGTVTSGGFAESIPCLEGNNFNAETSVHAVIENGNPETEYQYRLRVTDANGPSYGTVETFKTFDAVKELATGEATAITSTEATLNGELNPDGIETYYWFEYGTGFSFNLKAPLPVPPGGSAGSVAGLRPVSVTLTGLEAGLSASGTEYRYRLVGENAFGKTVGTAKTFRTLPNVKGVTTLPVSDLSLTSATLNGSFETEGEDTHYYFEWGATGSYGNYAPEGPPGVDGGEASGVTTVSAHLSGLEAGSTFHYRIVAVNSAGKTVGVDQVVKLGQAPLISGDRATEINTDTAVLEATINPANRETTYHWEYGAEDCSVAVCEQTEPVSIPAGVDGVPVHYTLEGLTPGTTYHFRLVTSNELGLTVGEDHPFITFAPESSVDTCPNVLVRKQTGASATRHCRAYELVSAANTEGYDVASNLIAGVSSLPGFPNAEGKVLYTLRFGAIPGSGDPTNRGEDPYVATRGPNGWTTEYVGLQADGMPSTRPFSSTLLEADQQLDSFAFGGPETCDPCFPDGSRNIPLRLPNGSLVKGMAGSESPAAEPAGAVAKRFSADGGSFVFGSTSRFVPTGNEGSLTIYERTLPNGPTQVVSTKPDGSTMSGAGVAELDVSADGSRVLVGRQVGVDAAGNPRYDLYMHIGDDPHSVLIAEGAEGVIYAGMTADGSQVYFTTNEQLAGDGDLFSSDLFRADVTASGATVSEVSTGSGGSGNSDACNPVANTDGEHWNEPGAVSPATCSVVAIGGGGGVASGSGTVYFFSPEKLDPSSSAVPGQPNLYVAEPGSQPEFVATLEPNNPAVRDAVARAAQRETADFQATPDGKFAVFDSAQRLTSETTAGYDEIYRSEVGGGIDCVSCSSSKAAPNTNTQLTKGGLNLVKDGRVFFTSDEQLVLRDTNQLEDAYEWGEGKVALISTGIDTNDSGLLSASADGKDVYFFTRQTLAPQDENGGTMKIYDAREGGGFLYNPPPRPCVASDECHGPGTQPPPPPAINTIEGTGEPQPTLGGKKRPASKHCHKGFVKRHGKCVKTRKRGHHRAKHHGRHGKRHHGQGKHRGHGKEHHHG